LVNQRAANPGLVETGKRKQQNGLELTRGPIVSVLLRLAWPIMVSDLLQTAYNLVDTFWVAKVGAAAVAAVSISFPIVFFLFAVGMGFTIAGTALVAQYTGAGDGSYANRVAGQTLSFVSAIALFFTVVGFFFHRHFLVWMNAGPEVLPLASGYLRVIFAGVIFMFFFFVFSSVLRGSGDTVTPMKLMAVSVGLNVVLDPVLIFGLGPFPEMGVVGAAVATVFSRGVVAVYGIAVLFTGWYGIHLRLVHLVPDPGLVKKIFVIGLPAALDRSARALGLAVMTGVVGVFGTVALAAYGIVGRILSLVFMPSIGMAAASTTMVGQNLGADLPSRARKSAWTGVVLNFLGLTLLGLLFFLFPHQAIVVFTRDPEVLRIGSEFIRITALSFGSMGAIIVAGGALQGAGKTVPAMVFSVLSLWVLQIPLAILLPRYPGLGVAGIWWAITVSNVLTAFVAFVWLQRNRWQKVIEKPGPRDDGSEAGLLRDAHKP